MSYPQKGAGYQHNPRWAQELREGGAVPLPRERPHMDAARSQLRDELKMEQDRRALDDFISQDAAAQPQPARPRFDKFGRDTAEELERQRLKDQGQVDI